METLLKEKIISLDKINPDSNTFYEVAEISEEKMRQWVQMILTTYHPDYNPEPLLEKLGFKMEDIDRTLKETSIANGSLLDALISLWKKQGKKEISLEEYFGTFLLFKICLGEIEVIQIVFSPPALAPPSQQLTKDWA